MSKKLDPKEVELFLLDNLDFFESRESLVGELKFKHSSSAASSLLERQVLKLRDEHKNLIDLLTSFIDTASINEDLFNKSKDLTLKILESSSKKEIVNFLKDKDIKIHSDDIEMKNVIRTIGEHEITISPYPEISHSLKIKVNKN